MQQAETGRELEQLLDGMHRTLLAGDLAPLALLGADIDRLLARMEGVADRPQADRLRRKAARNAACLQAAARGVRAAQRRIAEIQAARLGLATYDGRGKRQDLPQGAGQLTRRF
ncbi:MAG TPA: hypothetical protein VGA75_07500 [Paracoccaceae bacterium]